MQKPKSKQHWEARGESVSIRQGMQKPKNKRHRVLQST